MKVEAALILVDIHTESDSIQQGRKHKNPKV